MLAAARQPPSVGLAVQEHAKRELHSGQQKWIATLRIAQVADQVKSETEVATHHLPCTSSHALPPMHALSPLHFLPYMHFLPCTSSPPAADEAAAVATARADRAAAYIRTTSEGAAATLQPPLLDVCLPVQKIKRTAKAEICRLKAKLEDADGAGVRSLEPIHPSTVQQPGHCAPILCHSSGHYIYLDSSGHFWRPLSISRLRRPLCSILIRLRGCRF